MGLMLVFQAQENNCHPATKYRDIVFD